MPLLMCPNCESGMREVSRNGVQIDICPQCRGVWLDRGELEKLMGAMRTAAAEVEQGWGQPAPPPQPQRDVRPHDRDHRQDHKREDYERQGYGRPYKKKSRFEDIFDIFD